MSGPARRIVIVLCGVRRGQSAELSELPFFEVLLLPEELSDELLSEDESFLAASLLVDDLR